VTDAKGYVVNEMFYSLQGEGARAGSANVFIRFAGCNLTCSKAVEGFDCDTDFSSGQRMNGEQMLARVKELVGDARTVHSAIGVIFTGGEPTLQVDDALVDLFESHGFVTCMETNGLRPAPRGLSWISCSPKTAEHTLQIEKAHELRYVRAANQALPKPRLSAGYYFLSPAFSDDEREFRANLAWCIKLCKENPTWRLSVQQHKLWSVR
jgi:7-carboxy-7-deazaguanine synthase